MPQEYDISVVISTYNRSEILAAAVDFLGGNIPRS